MKNFIISLVLILGVGLILTTTTSCTKERPWDESEDIGIDIYKQQGSAHLLVDFHTKQSESHQLKGSESLKLVCSEVKIITITALEDNTTVRIHGQLITLNKGDKYIWSSTK